MSCQFIWLHLLRIHRIFIAFSRWFLGVPSHSSFTMWEQISWLHGPVDVNVPAMYASQQHWAHKNSAISVPRLSERRIITRHNSGKYYSCYKCMKFLLPGFYWFFYSKFHLTVSYVGWEMCVQKSEKLNATVGYVMSMFLGDEEICIIYIKEGIYFRRSG